MIRSMTGFGEASAEHDGLHYFVEVRSLNSKYFKAVIRLPDEFQGLEAEFDSVLRRRLNRGTVTLTCTCTDISASAALEVNVPALERYIEQVRRAMAHSKGPAAVPVNLDVGSLLALPGVLQPPTNEEQRIARARAAFSPLVERACSGLLAMRTTEGAALADDLRRQHALIADRLGLIEQRAPDVVAEYERRLKARIDQMIQDAGLSLQPADLIKEIGVYAERTDIAEEIMRLQGHMEQFRGLVGDADDRPIGRTLDFLTQEMLREANTIASKSPDSGISRAIVEIKGAIDRIKEQVQNVE
ncbi:MAG: YicC/YloC family endoribonuclease [Phycisphaerales bacterium]